MPLQAYMRVEGRGFALRGFLHQAIELGGRGLVEAGLFFQAEETDRFQQAQGAEAVDVGGVLGRFEGHRDMAHRAQVVDLVRLDFAHDAIQVRGVGQVAIVQEEILVLDVGILVDVVDAFGVEQRSPALDAVDFVTLREQQFGQVGTILSRHTRDQRCFHGCP
jgi:hypothetical protein